MPLRVFLYAIKNYDWAETTNRKALSCYRLPGLGIQPVKALTCILEIEALLDQVLFSQTAQGIPYSSGRKIGLIYDILLSQEAVRLQHLDNQLG